MTSEHDGKLYEAAWLHHRWGLTQKQVAGELGVDKATVSRWLREAGARGLVTITVKPPGLREIEMRLRQTFGLARARVIPSVPLRPSASITARRGARIGEEDESADGGVGLDCASQDAQRAAELQNEELGNAAADFIGPSLKGGFGVGLGGGRAIASFARQLSLHCPMVGLDFFALAVSSREPFDICATSLTAICCSLVTSEFHRRVAQAASPGAVLSPSVRGHALRLPERGADFEAMASAADDYYDAAMKKVDLVVAGLGAIETCWVLDERERTRQAREVGAIGDILYDVFGEAGTPIRVEPAAAVFPFGIERLKQMVADGKEVIVISTGKASATYHALSCRENRFVTGIVTDERTARNILELQENTAR